MKHPRRREAVAGSAVDKTTYSKYENSRQVMDKSIERLFRYVVAAEIQSPRVPSE